ncbi:porin family protein [Ketobacter sp.]|uniref:porin family protein n=1 Tax=Ketobacter sp. TaxID=2083498 RepID=UPI000F24242A|nr:porin family protein [Ketobacter sp.]RLU01863.1 MAG: porin family protein [Ketobacter sp.]
MNKTVTHSAFALALLAAGSAMAADPYVGGSVLFVDAEFQDISEEASLTGITGRLGSMMNDNIGGEVRVSLGVGDDSIGSGIFDTDVELNSMIGGYLRAGAPVGSGFFPYAVLGFTRTELEYSNDYFGSDSESETDVSWGFGADLSLDRKMSLNVEYMNYYDKDGVEISGFSIGIASKI